MPYIKSARRHEYDPVIKPLLEALNAGNFNAPAGDVVDVGHLNYVFSTIVWRLFDQAPSYRHANDLLGVLEAVKQEFYRRQVGAYEDDKIVENGDLTIRTPAPPTRTLPVGHKVVKQALNSLLRKMS